MLNAFFLILVCSTGLTLADNILEVNQDNFEDVLKERKAMMLYVTSDECVKCKRIYHKFVITSQTFANDDVIFARVHDKSIADLFEITSYPGIVFYEFGSNKPRAYRGDLISNELSKLAIKALRGDFRSLDLKHSVELTKTNYDSIVEVKDQCKVVMLHETDDEDDVAVFEEFAEVFGNEEGVVIATLNVDKEKKLKKKFNTIEYPAYYVYSHVDGGKTKMDKVRFSIDEMVSLINKRCGTFRVKDGRLNPFAGLIPEIDKVLEKHGKDLYEVKRLDTLKKAVLKVIRKLRDTVDGDLAEFYVDLIDELIAEGSIEVLDAVRNRIYGEFDSASPLKMDQLFRKRNIVEKLIDIIGKHLMTNFARMDTNFEDPNSQNPDADNYQRMNFRDEL